MAVQHRRDVGRSRHALTAAPALSFAIFFLFIGTSSSSRAKYFLQRRNRCDAQARIGHVGDEGDRQAVHQHVDFIFTYTYWCRWMPWLIMIDHLSDFIFTYMFAVSSSVCVSSGVCVSSSDCISSSVCITIAFTTSVGHDANLNPILLQRVERNAPAHHIKNELLLVLERPVLDEHSHQRLDHRSCAYYFNRHVAMHVV